MEHRTIPYSCGPMNYPVILIEVYWTFPSEMEGKERMDRISALPQSMNEDEEEICRNSTGSKPVSHVPATQKGGSPMGTSICNGAYIHMGLPRRHIYKLGALMWQTIRIQFTCSLPCNHPTGSSSLGVYLSVDRRSSELLRQARLFTLRLLEEQSLTRAQWRKQLHA